MERFTHAEMADVHLGYRSCEWKWTSCNERVSTTLSQLTGSTTPNIQMSVSSERHLRESMDQPNGLVVWPPRSPDLACLEFLSLGAHEAIGVWNRCWNRRRPCRFWYHCGHARNLRMDTTINSPMIYCKHTRQWSCIRAVPVNTTAIISILNYLLCKSSLASEIAVRDHMYHNEIYLFWCSLPPVLIWTNSFRTLCIWTSMYENFNVKELCFIYLFKFYFSRKYI